MPDIFSTREIADLLGTETWRVRRLFECGRLSEPTRFAGKRAIPRTLIPDIVDALRERGWLQSTPDETQQSDVDMELRETANVTEG